MKKGVSGLKKKKDIDATLKVDVSDERRRRRVGTSEFLVIGDEDNETAPLIQTIRRKLNRGKNFVIMITGRTRSGKSLSGVKLAREIDPTFKVDERVVFKAKEFMELLENEEMEAGSVILWDEVGTGKSMSSRDWYSVLNKSVNYVLQTWGHRSLCLILTVPDKSMVDSQTRKLVNAHIKTKRIIRDRNVTRAKFHYTSAMDDKGNNIKKVMPRYKNYEGLGRIRTQYIEIKKPTARVVNKYKKIKEEFTKELNKDVHADIEELEQEEEKKESKKLDDDEIVEKYWDDLKDEIRYSKSVGRTIKQYIIRKKCNVTAQRANYLKDKFIEKSKEEGYPEFEEEKEEGESESSGEEKKEEEEEEEKEPEVLSEL